MDPLLKREEFAVSLRRAKRQETLKKKRAAGNVPSNQAELMKYLQAGDWVETTRLLTYGYRCEAAALHELVNSAKNDLINALPALN